MRKDYDKRLESLNKRRYDDTIRKAVLSDSFFSASYGKTTKYVLESMKEIDPNYTKNTYEASSKIQSHLQKGLSTDSISVEFEHQGSVPMNTNIKLHSDIDLVVLHNGFFSLELFDVSIFRILGSLKLKYDFVISKKFCLFQSQFSFWSECAA